MDQVIQPIGDKPLLVRRGATFTQIIVNQMKAADGNKYPVMFIGTGLHHSVTSCLLSILLFLMT